MDILAGIFAYLAGIGALLAGLAVSFFVFFSTPSQPLQQQTQPQSASAMLVRPSTPSKSAASSPDHVQPATRIKLGHHHKATASVVAQARRLIQEEHARRWAYQQDSSFSSRFLGYAD